MTEETVQGHWHQFKGKVKEQWGQLTDDDLDVINGNRDQLLGRIRARHGISKEQAEEEVDTWTRLNPTNFFERY